VVLDVDGHPANLRVERGALRDRPAREQAVDLEAEVVVEARGAVALDDEPAGPGARRPPAVVLAGRLRRLLEVALLVVSVEGHGPKCAAIPSGRA
jgi:hypothetical protein